MKADDNRPPANETAQTGRAPGGGHRQSEQDQGEERTSMVTTTPPPTVTDEMRRQAKRAPDSWIYAVDPAFEGAGDVPGWAVVGAFRVDEQGEISDEFQRNPNYQPSPVALGFPVPANEVENALQLAVTGLGGDDQVRDALREATVFVPHVPGVGIADLDAGLDRPVVHAFTSDRYLPAPVDWQYWERRPIPELVAAMGDRYLVLNPGSELELRLPAADLA
ncbi:type VII secretion system-associated protein [Micromonospora tarensis]|uniref:Type VII secretion system-associated protein n=1 Tax=Micromonospora tarensis TaxID=2806100 RepID=A0ABS1YIP5_9ACTN|nr:type VII secretion system-associated protein [Micromonospora tarensis]MBM0277242.1 type VII secretion system-associated protein [Micromonospora tarensis]